MATFTPGPWHFEPADQGDPSVGIGRTAGFVFADHPGGIDESIVICEMREPAYRVEPGTANDLDDGIRSCGDEGANGQLIAASPYLLEALLYFTRKPFDPQQAFRQARAAIVRAIGREGYEVQEGVINPPVPPLVAELLAACKLARAYGSQGDTPEGLSVSYILDQAIARAETAGDGV